MTTPSTPLRPLTDVRAIINAVGGVRTVMALTDAKSPQVVNNWCALNRFASHTYLILTEALERKGFCAAPSLWGIADPAERLSQADTVAAE